MVIAGLEVFIPWNEEAISDGIPSTSRVARMVAAISKLPSGARRWVPWSRATRLLWLWFGAPWCCLPRALAAERAIPYTGDALLWLQSAMQVVREKHLVEESGFLELCISELLSWGGRRMRAQVSDVCSTLRKALAKLPPGDTTTLV